MMVTNNSTNVQTAIAGKVLQGGGVGSASVFSTPTYPSTSGASRKILVSDGTNNVYSSETYATPGASGNVLTSDGTNWTSAAPPASDGYCISIATNGVANAADAAVYYIPLGQILTNTVITFGGSKYFIPKSGTVKAFYGAFSVTGTLGSAENVVMDLMVNGVFAETIASTVKLTATIVAFSNGSLSTAVSAGDYIQLRMTCPTWVTNPTNLTMSGSFNIV